MGTDAAIRYHRTASTESSDTITHFSKRHQVQSNSVSLGSWNYKKLVTSAAEDSVITKPDAVPTLEVYEGVGTYRYTDEAESARIAQARAQSLEFFQHIIHAESSVSLTSRIKNPVASATEFFIRRETYLLHVTRSIKNCGKIFL